MQQGLLVRNPRIENIFSIELLRHSLERVLILVFGCFLCYDLTVLSGKRLNVRRFSGDSEANSVDHVVLTAFFYSMLSVDGLMDMCWPEKRKWHMPASMRTEAELKHRTQEGYRSTESLIAGAIEYAGISLIQCKNLPRVSRCKE